MRWLLVREPQTMYWALGEVAAEVEKGAEEEAGEERAGDERELEDEQWRREAVRLDVRLAEDGDLRELEVTEVKLTLLRVMLTVSMNRAVAACVTIPSSPKVKPRRARRTHTYRQNW